MADLKSISTNLQTFSGLIQEAAALAAAGSWERAAVQSQFAARFAWMDHTGLFASEALEEVVGQIRTSIPSLPARRTVRTHMARRVIHVATQLYGAGGHTQMIARWIRQDPGSNHDLVLTRQGTATLPAKIMEHFPGSRGLVALDRQPGGLVKRATRLRRIVASADVVIVHAHPHDVVPALAFGLDDAPPTVYVNHADHVYWLGTSAASIVLNLRNSGRDLCISRRGVDPARCLVANRPLELSLGLAPNDAQRSIERSRWGADNGDFLVVSAAAGSKYDPVGPVSLIDLFCSFLRERPSARLLVAGPSPDGRWSEAYSATQGRIKALGRLSDVPALLSCADAYIDSFPFASLTSLLEAGAHGLPLVTFRGHSSECAILGSDCPGLDEHLLTPSTRPEFVAALSSLADSPGFRRAQGTAVLNAVLAGHSYAAWRETTANIYAKALNSTTPITTGHTVWRDGPLDEMVALVQQQTGFAGIGAAAADVVSLGRTRQRLKQWTALRTSQPTSASRLLPDWVLPKAADIRGRISSGSLRTVWTEVSGNKNVPPRRPVR